MNTSQLEYIDKKNNTFIDTYQDSIVRESVRARRRLNQYDAHSYILYIII